MVKQRSESSDITVVSELDMPSPSAKEGRSVQTVENVPESIDGMTDELAADHLLWSRIRSNLQGPFAEFLGTFIILMFGDGVVAQVVLSNGQKGNYQSITWGWG